MFLFFQISRLIYARATAIEMFLPFYSAGAAAWLGFFAIFFSYYWLTRQKSRVNLLALFFSWTAFLLALNAIPPLLQGKSDPIYSASGSSSGFFWPAVYQWDWVRQYGLSKFTHVNLFGDILNFGFFPSLSLALYALHVRKLQQSGEVLKNEKLFLRGMPFAMMNLMRGAVIVVAILLLFSRGTMASFLISGFVFIGFLCVKYPGNKKLIIMAAFVLSLFGIATWAGNLSRAAKEVATLTTEKGEKDSSSYTNKRGAELALAIYHKYPLAGAGYRGYTQFAREFDEDWEKGMPLAAYHMTPFSHYFNTLSEEGAGAFLYFLALLAWLVETVWRLFRTKSYYKFVMGLGFFCGVITVLFHAAFGILMQQYATASLTYACMGITLGILSPAFQHDA